MIKKSILIFLIVAFVSLCSVLGVLYYFNSSPCGSDRDGYRVFAVEKGENLISIADDLEKGDFIRSAFFLRLISRVSGTESSFKSGQYRISNGMGAKAIHDLLIKGSGILVKVTIPEGTTLIAVSSILEKAGIISSEDFMKAACSEEIREKYSISGKSAEGFLFPDSYLFTKGISPDKILDAMIGNFFEKLVSVYPDYRKLSFEELYDKVILASIVEREYRKAEEAPLIASVFYNRLENKIALSSCATVEYVMTELMGKKHPEYLTYDDIKIDSDYNTYIKRGLPPGPIANPGLISLKAAFFPAKTDYLYFLLKNRETGEHFFSKRFSEHNKAKALYLKKR